MIIAKSPLRISLGGGGTDLPSYYKVRGGKLIAAAINKHVYISIAQTFNKKFILKYSKLEETTNLKSLKHPIFREVLKLLEIKTPLNISSHADIPSGTGLGSSGSFTVSLIKALYEFKKKKISSEKLAQLACKIEIDILNEPIGKQDQYIAAYGGLKEFTFRKNGSVEVRNLKIKNLEKLEKNLLIFFTGYTRNASSILSTQNKKTKCFDKDMIRNLDEIKEMGIFSKSALLRGNFIEYGNILNEHWKLKKKRSNLMSNKKINYLYDYAIRNGAIGGKLIGAGGGGFLMFYSNNKKKLEKSFLSKGILKMNYKFDMRGTEIL